MKFAQNTGLLNEISFDRRNYTLCLPVIEMDSKTDAVFGNLQQFKISKQNKESQPLMSYTNLMKHLIDTADDARVLRNGAIIQSH